MKPVDLGVLPPGLARLQNNTIPEDHEAVVPETQSSGGTSGEEGGVEITLSPEAQDVLNFEAGLFGPAHSTAAQARFAVTQTPGLEGLPFGKVVSAIARGIEPSSLITQPQEQEEALIGEEEPILDAPAASVEETEEGEETLVPELILETEDPATIISGEELALALLIQEEETAA